MDAKRAIAGDDSEAFAGNPVFNVGIFEDMEVRGDFYAFDEAGADEGVMRTASDFKDASCGC